jgi:hypothetical protein
MKRIRTILIIATIYLSLVGIVTFSMFILEESIQTVIFGTWPAKNVHQWHLVLRGTDTIRGINKTMKIINYSAGWFQPFAFFSYRAYSKATDFYIIGAESEIFAHRPDLFVDRHVNFMFTPKRIEAVGDNQFLLTNGKIGIIFDQRPELKPQLIDGILQKSGNYLMVQ